MTDLNNILCDKCEKPMDDNCVEYGNGESGYICTDCYSSLADSHMKEDK